MEAAVGSREEETFIAYGVGWGKSGGNLCLDNVLAVGKVDLALVLALGDAGALVLFRGKEKGDVSGKVRLRVDGEERQRSVEQSVEVKRRRLSSEDGNWCGTLAVRSRWCM